ncbi:MAG TPA: hypothetical protein VGC32_12515 [Solirubrobacterales bacterium]
MTSPNGCANRTASSRSARRRPHPPAHQRGRRLSLKERRIVAYHEAGHALCRKLLGLDPPEILSIVPRGPALGFVGHSPTEDSYLKSRDEVVTLLGGRAAEEEVFGESFSGAVDDLSRVHLVCKQMVGEFGMGVAVDHDGPPPIAMPTGDYAVSDATRRDVDLAATTLAREAFRRARALLTANRACLDDLAATALIHETLTREELDEVFARHTLRGLVQTKGSSPALVAMAHGRRPTS